MDLETVALLAGPNEQYSSLLGWLIDDAGRADHGDREKTLDTDGRELQRRLLDTSFALDTAREQRVDHLVSEAGIRHGGAETGHDRGVISIFGPVRASRIAYRNRREANLYPADARWRLADDAYSLGIRVLTAYHLATSGYGQTQEIIDQRTGVIVGRKQLSDLAHDLARWIPDFYDLRAATATDLAPGDVIAMQGDGKGIALRPEHRTAAKSDAAHPGVKKMAEIVAVTTFTPAARTPEDIAAPAARRKEHPGPVARDKWVSASITDDMPAVIGRAFDEADWRDPHHLHQRVFLVDGNRQQITAIGEHAKKRGLKVPIIIDFIHAAEYVRKAAVQLNRGESATEISEWGDGQLLRITHGRARAVAATLASLAAKRRTHPRTRDQDLSDVDRAVTYLTNNHQHMRYDKALTNGWPIATGLIEGACRHVIEDRFGITGARWSPDGAEDILKIRAVVVTGDLDPYLAYYKQRYLTEHHLARYDPASIPDLGLDIAPRTPGITGIGNWRTRYCSRRLAAGMRATLCQVLRSRTRDETPAGGAKMNNLPNGPGIDKRTDADQDAFKNAVAEKTPASIESYGDMADHYSGRQSTPAEPDKASASGASAVRLMARS